MKLPRMLAAVAVSAIAFATQTAFAAGADVENRVNELLAKMTLEEKIGQLIQIGGAPEGAIAGLE